MKRIAICLVLAAVACGGNEPKPAKTGGDTAVGTTSSSGDGGSFKPMKDPALNVSEEIQRLCNLEESKKQPKFDFDSTELSPAEKDILDQVAKCMISGPLKGKNVLLVGRADARGETEDNMSLGHKRASGVKEYLASKGVEGPRMFETSRGELDATGTDEAGYAKDRRVDVEVKK
jgi:peptidoglycan-associated lipoprotein